MWVPVAGYSYYIRVGGCYDPHSCEESYTVSQKEEAARIDHPDPIYLPKKHGK